MTEWELQSRMRQVQQGLADVIAIVEVLIAEVRTQQKTARVLEDRLVEVQRERQRSE